MPPGVTALLVPMLTVLEELHHTRCTPALAQKRIQHIKAIHPTAQLELVWEYDAYNQAWDYTLLAHGLVAGVVALSYAPPDRAPWAFRGTESWSEHAVVRVNAITLYVGDVLTYLDSIWNHAPVLERLIAKGLIDDAIRRDSIELSATELQEAMDGFRRARGLLTATATEAWLTAKGLSYQRFEQLVEREAQLARLKDRVIASRMADWFTAELAGFDQVRLMILSFADVEHAQEIWRTAIQDPDRLAYQAEEAWTRGVLNETIGVLQTWLRHERPTWLPETAFGCPAGTILPLQPLPDGGIALIKVLSYQHAQRDQATQHAFRQKLFTAWLDEQRAQATITWNWGTHELQSQTPTVGD